MWEARKLSRKGLCSDYAVKTSFVRIETAFFCNFCFLVNTKCGLKVNEKTHKKTLYCLLEDCLDEQHPTRYLSLHQKFLLADPIFIPRWAYFWRSFVTHIDWKSSRATGGLGNRVVMCHPMVPKKDCIALVNVWIISCDGSFDFADFLALSSHYFILQSSSNIFQICFLFIFPLCFITLSGFRVLL